jgi:hypothetical protein
VTPVRPFARALAAWALAGATTAACAYNPLFPDPRGAEQRAHELDDRCARTSEATDAPALSPAVVEGVEPAYGAVQSGNDRAFRLRGARLRIAPRPEFSTESLRRSLECHEARVTLGGAAPLADDPFVLAGSWIDIDVSSTGDGFVVAVVVDDIPKARVVLARARSYARWMGR